MYIERSLEERLPSIPKNKAIVLFGARQVGKTSLIAHFVEGQTTDWYTGDNSEDILELTAPQSDAAVKMFLSGMEVVVIDEAQRIPGIGLILKRLVDAKTKTRIIITGSSALELAGGVMESAAGRLWPFKLHSLSVGEIAKSSSWSKVMHDIQYRLILGSYPEVVLNPEHGSGILASLCESMLFKDILAFGVIRKGDRFFRLIYCLAQNTGALVSAESLARECDLNGKTVENYITLLEQCFIIKQVFAYSNNLANELKKARKIYFCDVGIRNALLNDFSPFDTRSDKEKGTLWENFVFMERLKLHDNLGDGTRMFFWRDKQKHEIDIIEVDKDNKVTAIECKLSDDKKRFPSAFCSKYPNAELLVVTRRNFFKVFSGSADD